MACAASAITCLSIGAIFYQWQVNDLAIDIDVSIKRWIAEGRGSLVDAHTVEVALAAGGTRRLKAKHILVATGGVVTKLKIPGAVRGWRGPASPPSCTHAWSSMRAP